MRKRTAKLKTIPWDAAQYLKTDEDIAEYLDAVFEDGDPELIRHALGDIARAKGMISNRESCRPRTRKPVQGAFGARQSGVRHSAESDPRAGAEAQGGGVTTPLPSALPRRHENGARYSRSPSA